MLLRIAQGLWLAIVAGAIVSVSFSLGIDFFRNALVAPHAGLAMTLIIMAKVIYAFLVVRSLQRVQLGLRPAAAFYAYGIADIAKYVPGGVWSVASRVMLYRRLGVSASDMTRALLFEQFWLVGGAVAAGTIIWLLSRSLQFAPLIIGIALTLTVWGVLVLYCDRFFSRNSIPSSHSLQLALLQILAWLLCGFSFAITLPDSALAERAAAAAAFDFSFAAGLSAIFAPAGIGVREGGVAWLLSDKMAPEAAFAYVLAHRVIWLAADVAFFGAIVVFCRRSWLMASQAHPPLDTLDTQRETKNG